MKIDAKQLVLALPAAFLLLSADRLGPDRRPAPVVNDVSWAEAAPSLAPVDEGRYGRPGDPLNLVFAATPSSLRAALTTSGWIEVPATVRGSLYAALDEFLGARPVGAFPPVRDHLLIGRRQNMNWIMPERPFSRRRVFRLWFTGLVDPQGRAYWWGSARRGAEPDRDEARDFVAASLSQSRYLESSELTPLPQIPREAADDEGAAYRTDGRAAVISLKRVLEPPKAKASHPEPTAARPAP